MTKFLNFQKIGKLQMRNDWSKVLHKKFDTYFLGLTSFVKMRSVLSVSSRVARAVVATKRVPAFANLAIRTFASKAPPAVADEVRPALDEILAQEINHENSEQEIDQEYLDIKKSIEKNFVLKQEDGVAVVTLERKHKDETIVVKFDVQNETEDDDVGYDGDENDNPDYNEESYDDDEEGSKVGYGIQFDVEITKSNGNKLVFECLAGENLKISSIMHVPSGKSTTDEKLYFGPNFGDLEGSLQDAFYDYLEERKIDDDLSFFVLSHSRTKEQAEYVNWLNKLLEFTGKK